MSAEQVRYGIHDKLSPRQKVGVTMEAGAMVVTAVEIIATGLFLLPIAIGGLIFLLGRCIIKSEGRRKRHSKQSADHH